MLEQLEKLALSMEYSAVMIGDSARDAANAYKDCAERCRRTLRELQPESAPEPPPPPRPAPSATKGAFNPKGWLKGQ